MALFPISYQTLSSATTSVNIGSIPAENGSGVYFRDLILIATNIKSTTGNPNLSLRYNSNSSNYAHITMYGRGTASPTGNSVSTDNQISLYPEDIDTGSSVNFKLEVFDYQQLKQKSAICRSNNGNRVAIIGSKWNNTSIISDMQIFVNTGQIAAGATFALYGVAF